MEITAAIVRGGNSRFELSSLQLDAPRENEICVEISGVGLCHTDLVFASGRLPAFDLPAVLGHEGSGIVHSIGSKVTKVDVGDRVLITFGSCGHCDRCGDEDEAYCREWRAYNFAGKRLDGSKAIHDGDNEVSSHFFCQSSFATYALAYERNVVKVPDDVPLELMGPIGCGVQTGVGAVLNSLDAKEGSSLLITGGGSVGLSAVMGAKIAKCKTIILVEPKAKRREMAASFGATHTLDPAQFDNLAEAVRAIDPRGVDYALDTSGVPDILQAIMNCLGVKGTLGVVSVTPPDTPVPGNMLQVMGQGHTIKGIIEGDSSPDTFIPQLVEYYREGRLPFDKMIKTYALSDINQAVSDQHAGLCVKAVLLP
ncbi:MAG: NAD(P)-dependent alcohol dehydrogenase [Maricaulaceae bacterium]